MSKHKTQLTPDALAALVGTKKGGLTVVRVPEISAHPGRTVLVCRCNCGVERGMTWVGFRSTKNPACLECQSRRAYLKKRRELRAECARLKAERQPEERLLNIGGHGATARIQRAYDALPEDKRELVDRIVRSRVRLDDLHDATFDRATLAEAIDMVQHTPRKEILADLAPVQHRPAHQDYRNQGLYT